MYSVWYRRKREREASCVWLRLILGLARRCEREHDMRLLCVEYGAIRTAIRLIHDQYYVVSCWFQNVLLCVCVVVVFSSKLASFHSNNLFRVFCCTFIIAATILLDSINFCHQYRKIGFYSAIETLVRVFRCVFVLFGSYHENRLKSRTNSLATTRTAVSTTTTTTAFVQQCQQIHETIDQKEYWYYEDKNRCGRKKNDCDRRNRNATMWDLWKIVDQIKWKHQQNECCLWFDGYMDKAKQQQKSISALLANSFIQNCAIVHRSDCISYYLSISYQKIVCVRVCVCYPIHF